METTSTRTQTDIKNMYIPVETLITTMLMNLYSTLQLMALNTTTIPKKLTGPNGMIQNKGMQKSMKLQHLNISDVTEE